MGSLSPSGGRTLAVSPPFVACGAVLILCTADKHLSFGEEEAVPGYERPPTAERLASPAHDGECG